MAHKFRHLKLFSLLGISILTSIGVISGFSLANKGAERVDASTTTQKSAYNIWIHDQNTNLSSVHFWNLKFDSGYSMDDLVDWFTNFNGKMREDISDTFSGSITRKSDTEMDLWGMNYWTGSKHGQDGRHYIMQFPFFVSEMSYGVYTNDSYGSHYVDIKSHEGKLGTRAYCADAIWCNGGNIGMWYLDYNEGYKYSFTNYSITKKYSLSGSTGDTIGTDTYWKYLYYKKPSNPSNPTGYTFSKWTTDLAGSNEIGTTETFSGDTTIYAYCAAKTTTVTLNSQGGTGGTSSVTATYGLAMPSATMPTKQGHTFNGYFDATSGGTQYYTSTGESARNWDKESSSVTLYAQWTANTHTLSWVTDGDPLTGNYTSGTVAYGTTIVQPNTPTKSGYSFGGWTPSVPQTMPDNDLTLTATWVQNSVTATFVDGDGVTIHNQTVEKGAAFSYTGPTPTKTATAQYTYEFTGWNPELGPINVDTTFTAQFTAVTREYTITWIDGNGSTLGTSSVAYGTTPTYPSTLPTPTKEPSVSKTYTFNGNWSPTPVPVTGEASYIAQFDETTRQYTLAWNLNGGEVLDRSEYTEGGTYDYGTTITAPIVAKDGYVFNGWNPTFNSTLTGNTTYTAQWNRPSGYVLHNYTTHEVLPLTHNTSDNQWELKGFTVSSGDTFKVENWYSGGSTADQYYGFEQADQSQGGSAWESSQIGKDSESKKPNFKVNYAGSYDLYFHDTRDTNKIWIPKIAMVDNYQVRVTRNGTLVSTTNLIQETGEGKTSKDLVTESKVSLEAGDVIAIYNGSILLTMNAKSVSNNNCKNVDGVTTVVCEMKDYQNGPQNANYIYVDTNAKNIFCGGFDYDTNYMVITHNNETINYQKLNLNQTPIDPDHFREYLTPNDLTFYNGDVISFVDTTSGDGKAKAVPFKVGQIDPYSLSKEFEEQGDGTIKCVTSSDNGIVSRSYLKIGVGTEAGNNYVYFGDRYLEDAITFAKGFNAEISLVCKQDGSTIEAKLTVAWSNQAAAFNKLSDDAKAVLTHSAIYETYEDIRVFAAKYDYVYGKHGAEWGLDDFAKRNPSPISSSNMLSLLSNSNVTTLIAVISIISIISVSAIGAYFYLRKRKEH